jgi:hypothetical protein
MKIISMKKIMVFIRIFFLSILFYSCGGTIGNIEKYSFPNVSAGSLKAALNEVYDKYPELIKSDTSMYGNNNGEDFYYVLNNKERKEVFKCNVIAYPTPNEKETDLSLTTATTWGETMHVATKMGFWEKRKYRKLFEENILPKIKEQLKGE